MHRTAVARGTTLYARNGQTVSRAANGPKVLTMNNSFGASGIGLFALSGSLYEPQQAVGATAVMEALALKDNDCFPATELSQDIGVLGNNLRVTNYRECLSYSLSCPRYHHRAALEILNGIALHPTRNPQVFAETKAVVQERLGLVHRNATMCLFELMHEASWNGKGLGRPSNPTAEEVERLTLEDFHRFHKRHTTGNRCCIVGTGVDDHDAFVELVEATLRFPEEATGAVSAGDTATDVLSPYTGGVRLRNVTEAPESTTKFAEKNLTHVGLNFKGYTMAHPNYYVASVIQSLLGGGTSFSSGGPGKGMHTKLFREVINREGWLHGIECVTAWYTGGGLVGLYAQSEHQWASNLLQVLMFQAATIPSRLTNDHWEMAKNQLVSQLILLGENRDVQLEEAGKYCLLHDKLLVTEELIESTQKLTLKDLKRVCAEMLESPVAFAVYGNTEALPTETASIEAQLKALSRKYGGK